MAIPIILKGDKSASVPLAIATNYDYTGCTLIVDFGGCQKTFTDLQAGGTVNLEYSSSQTAEFPLGTGRVMLSLRNSAGEVRTLPWAKIKVTDSPAEVYGAAITIDPATLNVEDLTAGDSLGVVKSRMNAVLAFLRGLTNSAVCVALCLATSAMADVVPLYTTPNDMPGDAPLMTNVEEYVSARMSEAAASLAPSNLVGKVFDSSESYRTGEVVLFSNELYRATRHNAAPSLPPVPAYSHMWDKLENPAIDEAIGGPLMDRYLRLGTGGYNDAQEFKVRIGTAGDGGVSYLHGYNGYIGVRNTKDDRAAYLTPNGHIYVVRNGTGYNLYDLGQFLMRNTVYPITGQYAREEYKDSLVTSPYYVKQFLESNYIDNATAEATYAPKANTFTKGEVLDEIAGALGSHAATNLYDVTKTKRIDGDGRVYEIAPPTITFSNSYAQVFMPLDGVEDWWQCVADDVTNDLVYVNFKWILRRNSSNVGMGAGAHDADAVLFNDGGTALTFYRVAIPGEWRNVGTIARAEDIGTATNDLAKTIPNNITRTATDATLVHCGDGSCTNALIYIRQASSSLAGLMTAADKATFDSMKTSMVSREVVTNIVRDLSLGGIWDESLQVWWTPRMRNGSLTYEATTNVNLNAEN